MVKITYVDHAGEEQTIDAVPGRSLMKNAVRNRVKGIIGECGGNTRCGTCRIYFADQWLAKLELPRADELEMIDFAGDTTPGVRLSCQIAVSEAMEGLYVRMPRDPYPEG
jgi:ferredoxin, 2Fe-2S